MKPRGFRRPIAPVLIMAIGVVVLFGSLRPGAHAANRTEVQRIVVEEALRAGFPPTLAMAVAEVGSDFRDDAKGPGGARGVMQIRPATAEKLYDINREELWDARLNVRIGIDYLESLIREHNGRWDVALARYHGPPDQQGDAGTAAPDPYVGKVLRAQRRYREQSSLWAAEAAVGRVRADEAPLGTSQTRGLEQAQPTTAPSHGSIPEDLETGIFDDFQNVIELRRRAARRTLDDFADVYRWSPPAARE